MGESKLKKNFHPCCHVKKQESLMGFYLKEDKTEASRRKRKGKEDQNSLFITYESVFPVSYVHNSNTNFNTKSFEIKVFFFNNKWCYFSND